MLELIYHVPLILECLGKTLVTFDFDEKLTQSIAQITMYYHLLDDFLGLHFEVDQFQHIQKN